MAKANGGAGCCRENGSAGCSGPSSNDSGEVVRRFTPPGMLEHQPDTELIFPPVLRKHDFQPLAFGNRRKKWYRPVTTQQLLEIKNAYPSAKIIGGSTETQIEVTLGRIVVSHGC
jgi:xanthine dehydrogenase/oxidase